MPRTDTSTRSEFVIPNEGGIKFPQPPGSSPEVTITLFAGSEQATGLHWHETHTEILRVTQGTACVETDGVVRDITEQDAAVVIKPSVRHQFWRADRAVKLISELAYHVVPNTERTPRGTITMGKDFVSVQVDVYD
jgi:mannose-6-phosphate isomerase-like protein (cupin superfamily)